MIIHRCLSHYSEWNMSYHSRQYSVDNTTRFTLEREASTGVNEPVMERGDWYHRILKLSQSSKL